MCVIRPTVAILLVVLGLTVSSCTSREAPSLTATATSSPHVADGQQSGPEFTVRLVKVTGETPTGKVRPRDLAKPADAVRTTVKDLYETGFVDPSLRDDGKYPSLLPLFAGQTRDRAKSDLDRLTLGPAASEIDEVLPARATLKLEFLADEQRHPIVAFAQTVFDATAFAQDRHAPITQHGDYVLRKLNGAWRIVSYDVRTRVPRPAQMRSEFGEAAFAPGLPSNGPVFVLAIGSDARPGQSVEATRADSIHVIGVNPKLGRVSIIGIPRDSWVSMPGAGTDKINAALVRGGPELLVRTVEQLTGIPIDAYVLTGFDGFQQIVAAVGGFDIKVPYPIDDPAARADFKRGPEHLSGAEALAFSRARHDVPAGDFSRSFNQGKVIVAALATLREQMQRGPAALIPWVLAGKQQLRTDLRLDDLFELLLAAHGFEPRRVRNTVALGRTGTIAGKSVVILDARAYAAFRDVARDGVLGGHG